LYSWKTKRGVGRGRRINTRKEKSWVTGEEENKSRTVLGKMPRRRKARGRGKVRFKGLFIRGPAKDKSKGKGTRDTSHFWEERQERRKTRTGGS